ncbi:protein kinase [Collinsella sp. An307]|uniref:protein kinase domain-containing protein n=1 Tax=Collinsella sp. An307 TaxID=1965630 RepID=UPI001302DD86|nr:protein kinase [Collinsella sp. An307]
MTDDLAAYLEAVGREDSFVVERRLGGGGRTTELVVVSEYVPGETLEEVTRARGASLALAQKVVPEVCDAVEELHSACDPPLIHRDLKPQKIIVAPAGLFLIDFGIARRFREKAETDTVRFGTRAYAPPEQYGFGQTDVRSDIYALGGILWYCLTGDDPSASLVPHEVSGRVGEKLAGVIRRAMAFDPAERFQSVAELARTFREAVGDAAGTAKAGMPRAAEDARQADGRRGSGFFRTNLLGVARNVVLLLIALACIPQAWQGVVAPRAEYAGKSLWYLVALNFLLTLPLVWGALYLAMDRTVLARLIPGLAQRSRLKDACIIGIYLVIAFVIALFIPSS